MVKNMEEPKLIGYVRRATDKTKIKISVNVEALKECQTYETSDEQHYYALDIDMEALLRVLIGQRAVTCIISGTQTAVGEE